MDTYYGSDSLGIPVDGKRVYLPKALSPDGRMFMRLKMDQLPE